MTNKCVPHDMPFTHDDRLAKASQAGGQVVTNLEEFRSNRDRDEAQLRHEITLAYVDLGAATFALGRHGALIDARLAPRVQRIYELTCELAARVQADSISHQPGD